MEVFNLNRFGKEIKSFFNNPLGIIGMFLVLTEGIAAIVITQSQLEFLLNLILVIFIVLFPIVTLSCFVYLVIKHHKKLYGPSDYKDEANFLLTFNNETQETEVIKVTSVSENKSLHIDSNMQQFEKKDFQVLVNQRLDNYRKLIDNLELKSIPAKIYSSSLNYGTNEDDAAESIWLGKDVPLDLAKKVLDICFNTSEKLKYIRLSEPNIGSAQLQIFIGGSKNTSLKRGTKELNDDLKEKLVASNTIEELHSLIMDNYI
ncbi:TPA: hypothetical protein IUT60_000334 [Enterococcus faecalis]|jgi:hypothetical protein|nr:hypothetical protein [Enterococcus faecalis]EIR3939678.1 hypothetical protein [Enterococcus faecalis]EKN1411095.1 hypothetical protein [Enterococcus faecalis]ELY8230265.1 hypothetical protein [Enterococcus faecalis]NSU58450.1 hypothetical protein [Enterococcus faecalis]